MAVHKASDVEPHRVLVAGSRTHLFVSAAVLALTLGIATGARAAEQEEPAVDEIVVTAERRSEGLRTIPIAISAYSSAVLKTSGISGVSDLQQLSSSVQFGQGQNNPFVSIRGIGSELPNIGSESGVAISIDGVTLSNRYMFDTAFVDVERVEILRGPQGTIAGRNATGGAINIISKRPTGAFSGSLTATLGNYGRLEGEGFINAPIAGDKLLARLSLKVVDADGWIKDVAQNRDVNDTKRIQGRLYLLSRVSDTLEASLIFDGSRDRSLILPGVDAGPVRPDRPSAPDFFNVPRTDLDKLVISTNTPINPRNRRDRGQVTLGLKWDIGPSASLSSTTGYISFFNRFAGDFDGGQANLAAVPDYYAKGHQLSQELTLAADLTDRLDLILGAIYLDSHAKSSIEIGFPQIGLPPGALHFVASQDLRSYAVYSQLRYKLTDSLRVSIGGRYTHDRKKYSELDSVFGSPFFPTGGSPASSSWQAFTPRAAVDFRPNDDVTLFASISKGFKSGGFNTFADPVDKFEPEYVLNYEAGVKGRFLDNRLNASLTGFYMDYKDLQQSIFGLTAGSFLPRTLNAASATIKGLEVELDARLSDNFRLTSAGTWLDAKYDSLRSHDALFPELGVLGPAGLNIRDASGNRLVRAPKFQWNISGEFTTPIGESWALSARANYAWQDRIYFDVFNHPLVSQKAFGLTNLHASLRSEGTGWSISAAVTNLFDKRYFTQHFTSTGIGPVASHLGGLGEPRMYKLSVGYSF